MSELAFPTAGDSLHRPLQVPQVQPFPADVATVAEETNAGPQYRLSLWASRSGPARPLPTHLGRWTMTSTEW